VVGSPLPWLLGFPRPAPRVLPEPVSVSIRLPVLPDVGRRPRVAEVRRVLPVPGLVEVRNADDLRVDDRRGTDLPEPAAPLLPAAAPAGASIRYAPACCRVTAAPGVSTSKDSSSRRRRTENDATPERTASCVTPSARFRTDNSDRGPTSTRFPPCSSSSNRPSLPEKSRSPATIGALTAALRQTRGSSARLSATPPARKEIRATLRRLSSFSG
jgi:hypothetical protein